MLSQAVPIIQSGPALPPGVLDTAYNLFCSLLFFAFPFLDFEDASFRVPQMPVGSPSIWYFDFSYYGKQHDSCLRKRYHFRLLCDLWTGWLWHPLPDYHCTTRRNNLAGVELNKSQWELWRIYSCQ